MIKKEIRDAMLTRLKDLSSCQRARWSRQLNDNILQSTAYKQSGVLATYLSLPHEWDTAYLIERAQADGKRVLIPKTYAQGRMVFVDYSPNRLEMGKFGILEPKDVEAFVEKSEIDLIHVPGLIWNREGFRIGHGGGFYDRYLVDFKGWTISALMNFQLMDFVPEWCDQTVKEMMIVEESDR